MAMIFSREDSVEFDKNNGVAETMRPDDSKPASLRRQDVYIFDEKLCIPDFDCLIERPRLNDLLERSMTRFNASLICGRAGTGKSAVAASFAATYARAAWYTVESSDVDWHLFCRYFSASLFKATAGTKKPPGNIYPGDITREEIGEFLATLFFQVERRSKGPILVVLDNIHHVFDANWFGDFFTQLLFSLLPGIHVLMLCRSKPALPLFRLRSKQVLNVIDEKLIAFNREETEAICRSYGQPGTRAKKILSESFGRISKIIHLVDRR